MDGSQLQCPGCKARLDSKNQVPPVAAIAATGYFTCCLSCGKLLVLHNAAGMAVARLTVASELRALQLSSPALYNELVAVSTVVLLLKNSGGT